MAQKRATTTTMKHYSCCSLQFHNFVYIPCLQWLKPLINYALGNNYVFRPKFRLGCARIWHFLGPKFSVWRWLANWLGRLKELQASNCGIAWKPSSSEKNPSNYEGAVSYGSELLYMKFDSHFAPSAFEGANSLDVSELLDSQFAPLLVKESK